MKSNRKENNDWSDEAFLFENFIFGSFWDAFGDLPVGIIVIDLQASVRFLNSMAGYFIGIQPSLAIGKLIQEISSETQIIETLSTGVPLYDKQKFLNGLQLKCSSIPIRFQGRVVSAVEVMLNHSDKLSMAKELEELREKYDFLDVLLEEAFEELGAVDKKGIITYITSKSARNLGVGRNEAVGRDMSTIDPKCLLKKVARTGIPQVAEISRPYKKTVPVIVSPLYKRNHLLGAVCRSIFNDMAEARNFLSRLQKLDEAQTNTQHPRKISGRKISGCKFSFDDIIGKSRAIVYAKEKALRAAEGDSNILITGESGTGKELFAQAIHMASPRRNGPFVQINCAGIPENLLESELFGYEPGSFTGARKEGKPGKFELAHNGTIFLDEVGDMPMGMQAKLLRVIQENEIEPLGGTASYEIDIRIIAATNKNLWGMLNRGQFREDLYYRLDVVNIHIPPLRHRIKDILLLIEHFIPIINKRANSQLEGVTQEVLDHFLRYDWPGNIRELRNVLEGAMNLNSGELIEMQALPSRIRKKMTGNFQLKPGGSEGGIVAFKDREAAEKAMIEQALIVKNGNKRQAAIYLNMCRATFYNKLKKYDIHFTHNLHPFQHESSFFGD